MTFLEEVLERVGVSGIIFLAIALYLFKWAFDLVTDPLRDIPGPFLSRFTRLWLLRQYVKGDYQKTNVELHEQFGPIIRVAPNQYSVDSPDAAKIIYGHGSNFTKASWYKPWGHANPEFKNLFNDLDPKSHSVLRRKVANTYSMSSLVSYEPYVDECTTIFLQRLAEFASSGEVFNMGHWFQCYAFETIGMITFSKRLGFLNQGEDINGIMEQLEFGALYSSAVGLFPSWHQTLLTILSKMSSEVKGTAFIDAYSNELITAQRHEKLPDADGPSDFITKFLTVQRENPEKMTDKDILVSIGANIGAGSDTTSITLSAILYHLCKNPRTMQKLREELDSANDEGRISDPITFKEAQELPYLQAVIKEGLRIHPATAYTMPRIVPNGGKEIIGRYFPSGATVGINSWVAHRNREVFGNDANLFRPERWLEGKESSGQREAYFFSFGQGSRTCIGKNISLLEISKAIPQVVRHMDFEVENQSEWTVVSHWFAKPKDFTCRVKRRGS